jgi:alpha-glucosidase
VGSSQGLLFEDDGESWGYKEDDALWLTWEMVCDASTISLQLTLAAVIARPGMR